MAGLFKDFLISAPPTAVEQEKISLKELCAEDMALFGKTYFPHVFDKDYCEFHIELIQNLQNVTLNASGRKNYICRAAPRGHGKSQIISFLYVLWCICYGYKSNILIISDTNDQAKNFLLAIKNELEDNDQLIADFGNLVGKLWSQDKIVTANNIQIMGRGAGQKLRGTKSLDNKRPDAIIIDDLENDLNVETETQRQRLKNWLLKALLPCGCPTCDYIYIGTIMHYEALLYNVLHEPKFAIWNRKIFRAITKFSDSALWVEWEAIMTDLTLDDPGESAYQFYQNHKQEMIEDIEVLWGGQDPDYYYNLMIIRLQDQAAFNSEYQNEPIDPTRSEILETWFSYYDELPEIVEVYGAVDPSLGKAKSDCSAIIWIGKDTNNYLYVLEVDIGRKTPDAIIDAITRGAITYGDKIQTFVVETVQFQAMFAEELERRSVAIGLYMDITKFKNQTDKLLRIRGLIPKIKNGYLKFNPRTQQPLLNELRRFPKGRDDGMDALEMAVSAAAPNVTGICFGSMSMRVRW